MGQPDPFALFQKRPRWRAEMKKAAGLVLVFVSLLLFTPAIYVLTEFLLRAHPQSDLQGSILAFLPPIAVAIASMYAIHRGFEPTKMRAFGTLLFYAASVVFSLLLAGSGIVIAYGVQVALFGE